MNVTFSPCVPQKQLRTKVPKTEFKPLYQDRLGWLYTRTISPKPQLFDLYTRKVYAFSQLATEQPRAMHKVLLP